MQRAAVAKMVQAVRTLDNLDVPEPSTSGREYLLQMVHRLLDFRRPELEALASLEGCRPNQVSWRRPHCNVEHSPFWYIRLPSEEVAKAVSKRMILTKVCGWVGDGGGGCMGSVWVGGGGACGQAGGTTTQVH